MCSLNNNKHRSPQQSPKKWIQDDPMSFSRPLNLSPLNFRSHVFFKTTQSKPIEFTGQKAQQNMTMDLKMNRFGSLDKSDI